MLVGLARAEDDRTDLVDGVVVVGKYEDVADPDREVNGRRRHVERLARPQANRCAGRDHEGERVRPLRR